MPKKIIVKRGLNSFRYAAYTENGRIEIKLGLVEIVRQLGCPEP